MTSTYSVPDRFYRDGFVHVHGLPTLAAAQSLIEAFLAGIDVIRTPMLAPFANRIRLAQIARIPHSSCTDAIRTSFLALHFEMGIPLVPLGEEAGFHLLLCLYLPADGPPAETVTRLLPIRDLLSPAAEARLVDYVTRHGDGWGDYNSGRLSCVGNLLDAVSGTTELTYMRNFRIAEWFNLDETKTPRDGRMAENEFFAARGIALPEVEHLIHLLPGDLLIVDNVRVAHGRLGQRAGESLYQFLYGVPSVSPVEIANLRRNLCQSRD